MSARPPHLSGHGNPHVHGSRRAGLHGLPFLG